MSIVALLERGRRRSGGAPALRAGGIDVSYAELIESVIQTAKALRESGFGHGHRIGVASPNDPAALLASFSVLASGATYVPVSSTYSPAEMESVLDRFDCTGFIYHESLSAAAESFLDRRADRVRFFRIDNGAPSAVGDPAPSAGVESFQALRTRATTSDDLAPPRPTDIGWMGLTGGTTGLPKGVQISWGAVSAFIAKFGADFPTQRPRQLAAAPLTHGAGMLAMAGLARGGTIVMTNGLNPPEFLSLIERERITETFLPPTAIYKLLEHPDVLGYEYSSLTNLFYGAAPMSTRRLREAIATFGPVLTQMYGQTESHTMISVLHPADHFAGGDIHGEIADDSRLSSCGWPSIGTLIEIRDDSGARMPIGTPGEICVASDLNMSGYYDNPDETAKVLQDGFVLTGDIGFIDEDGCLHLVDRKKDMVITGGFNVYPAEVELVLQRLPEVAGCAVVGVPDDYWGEVLVAAVQLADGAILDAEQLTAVLRRELGPVKTPKRIVFLDEMPQSGVGKVLRTAVREVVLARFATTRG